MDVLAQCIVTKFCGVLTQAYKDNESKHNPTKLRRTVRKVRASLAPYTELVQPAMWKWSERAENL